MLRSQTATVVSIFLPFDSLFIYPSSPCSSTWHRASIFPQRGHFPMYQLRLSKQQSLGKFALVQDYVNYHGIITSLKQAEINYLWWNECEMRKQWWGQKEGKKEKEETTCQRKSSHCVLVPWRNCSTTWLSEWVKGGKGVVGEEDEDHPHLHPMQSSSPPRAQAEPAHFPRVINHGEYQL